MAKKADFSEDEWKLLINTPRYILLALRAADKTSKDVADSEEQGMIEYLTAYKSRSPLVRSVLADQENASKRLRTKSPLDYIERTGKLLDNKANDSSGEAVRKLLIGTSSAIANAVRESRRKDADSITKKEQAVLDQIAEVLESERAKRAKQSKASAKPKSSRSKNESESEGKTPAKPAPAPPRRTMRGGTGVRRRPSISRSAPDQPAPQPTIRKPKPKSQIIGPQRPQGSRSTNQKTVRGKRPVRAAMPSGPQPNVKTSGPSLANVSLSNVVEMDETIATRWTNLYATPQPDSALDAGLAPDTVVTVLGRDQWGGWILIETGDDAGWVPRDALSLDSAEGLLMVDESGLDISEPLVQEDAVATVSDEIVDVVEDATSAEFEVVETMTTTRRTNLFSQPKTNAKSEAVLKPKTRVVLLGASGSWINVRVNDSEGWIPAEAFG